ncbi:MAG: hypothetical protein ACREN8_04980 [Candidatus Dormibacteraceae bacterium]
MRLVVAPEGVSPQSIVAMGATSVQMRIVESGHVIDYKAGILGFLDLTMQIIALARQELCRTEPVTPTPTGRTPPVRRGAYGQARCHRVPPH